MKEYIKAKTFVEKHKLNQIQASSFYGSISGLKLKKYEFTDGVKFLESDLKQLLKSKNNNIVNIKVGQIWIVRTKDFKGTEKFKNNSRKGLTTYFLEKGEHIEIRYPYNWHYRTEDNIYMHSTDFDIKKHCVLLGEIDYKVRMNNKATLEEILKLELYTKN